MRWRPMIAALVLALALRGEAVAQPTAVTIHQNLSSVATESALPVSGRLGDVVLVRDVKALVWWNGTTWNDLASGGGGAPGQDGRTILSGAGPPSSGLGSDGDFYINTAAKTVSGPKWAGAWGSETSLVGPPGARGPAGAAGADGSAGADGLPRHVADEASALTDRTTLNFIGPGVTCVDNSGASRTDCTVPGRPATYAGSPSPGGPATTALALATTLPSAEAGLLLWFEARTLGLSDGDAVSTWADLSGHGNNAVESTPGFRPVYHTGLLNGGPAVSFSGGQCLTVPSLMLSTFSIFIVFRATLSGMLYEHSPDSNGNSGSQLYGGRGSTLRVNRAGGSDNRSVSAPAGTSEWGNQGEWRVVQAEFGGTHGSNLIVLDGYRPLMDNDQVATPGTSSVTAPFYIGCRGEASVFLTGDIAAVIGFTPELLPDAQRRVRSYLNSWTNVY